MMRYGVVGVGYFGADLARFMNEFDDAQITMVYDPENGETIAQELQCVAAKSLEELVTSPDVDCVIVATPNYLHKEPVILAAKNKKHVFCEKPIALSYQDCDDMVRACEENGVTFMAGHVMNFFNGVHHAKELDCVQFIMGGMPKTVTMAAANVAHKGEKFGDEDDMIFVTMEYDDNRFAVLEWGSAFRWGEHYVLIQGEKGAIKLDMYNTKGTLRVDGKDTYFLIHETQEEDDDRTRIYNSTEMDGAIQYGKPGKRTPLWLSSIMKKEMRYLNDILHGMEPTEEFVKLLTGEAARAAIATADACTRSRYENRKVDLSEIIGK